MSLFDGVMFLAALVYALIPYSALYLFTIRSKKNLTGTDIVSAVLWGITGFILTALPVASFSLNAYCIAHAIACIPAVIWLSSALLRGRLLLSRPLPVLPLFIASIAFLVRLAPYLTGGNWFGEGDMRFHNILAKSIIVNDALPRTWEPFAGIPVNYPLGGHMLGAFVSIHSQLPVHAVLNVLLCIYGAITTGIIYILSRHLFRNSAAALLSSIAYGFLALAGSLDYIRWGGMPNAVAMLLLTFLAHELLRCHPESPGGRTQVYAPALIAAAVILTHHYSAMVMFLFGGALMVLTPLRSAARRAASCIPLGLFLALLVLHVCGQFRSTEIGTTSIFVFYEHPISIVEAVTSLNAPFAILGMLGLILILKKDIPGELSVISAWITVYFAAFVLLEYVYRLGVFSFTDGRHFFTALTPSRLIADLAYPLSLAAGAIVLHRRFETFSRHFFAVLAAVSLVSSLLFFLSLQGASKIPGANEAVDWISTNVPDNAVIVGSLPHLEYRSWRRTSAPPIPASEARNHPDLKSLRDIKSPAEWQAYSEPRNLKCYFILSSDTVTSESGMKALHSAGGISVCILPEAK